MTLAGVPGSLLRGDPVAAHGCHPQHSKQLSRDQHPSHGSTFSALSYARRPAAPQRHGRSSCYAIKIPWLEPEDLPASFLDELVGMLDNTATTTSRSSSSRMGHAPENLGNTAGGTHPRMYVSCVSCRAGCVQLVLDVLDVQQQGGQLLPLAAAVTGAGGGFMLRVPPRSGAAGPLTAQPLAAVAELAAVAGTSGAPGSAGLAPRPDLDMCVEVEVDEGDVCADMMHLVGVLCALLPQLHPPPGARVIVQRPFRPRGPSGGRAGGSSNSRSDGNVLDAVVAQWLGPEAGWHVLPWRANDALGQQQQQQQAQQQVHQRQVQPGQGAGTTQRVAPLPLQQQQQQQHPSRPGSTSSSQPIAVSFSGTTPSAYLGAARGSAAPANLPPSRPTHSTSAPGASAPPPRPQPPISAPGFAQAGTQRAHRAEPAPPNPTHSTSPFTTDVAPHLPKQYCGSFREAVEEMGVPGNAAVQQLRRQYVRPKADLLRKSRSSTIHRSAPHIDARGCSIGGSTAGGQRGRQQKGDNAPSSAMAGEDDIGDEWDTARGPKARDTASAARPAPAPGLRAGVVSPARQRVSSTVAPRAPYRSARHALDEDQGIDRLHAEALGPASPAQHGQIRTRQLSPQMTSQPLQRLAPLERGLTAPGPSSQLYPSQRPDAAGSAAADPGGASQEGPKACVRAPLPSWPLAGTPHTPNNIDNVAEGTVSDRLLDSSNPDRPWMVNTCATDRSLCAAQVCDMAHNPSLCSYGSPEELPFELLWSSPRGVTAAAAERRCVWSAADGVMTPPSRRQRVPSGVVHRPPLRQGSSTLRGGGGGGVWPRDQKWERWPDLGDGSVHGGAEDALPALLERRGDAAGPSAASRTVAFGRMAAGSGSGAGGAGVEDDEAMLLMLGPSSLPTGLVGSRDVQDCADEPTLTFMSLSAPDPTDSVFQQQLSLEADAGGSMGTVAEAAGAAASLGTTSSVVAASGLRIARAAGPPTGPGAGRRAPHRLLVLGSKATSSGAAAWLHTDWGMESALENAAGVGRAASAASAGGAWAMVTSALADGAWGCAPVGPAAELGGGGGTASGGGRPNSFNASLLELTPAEQLEAAAVLATAITGSCSNGEAAGAAAGPGSGPLEAGVARPSAPAPRLQSVHLASGRTITMMQQAAGQTGVAHSAIGAAPALPATGPAVAAASGNAASTDALLGLSQDPWSAGSAWTADAVNIFPFAVVPPSRPLATVRFSIHGLPPALLTAAVTMARNSSSVTAAVVAAGPRSMDASAGLQRPAFASAAGSAGGGGGTLGTSVGDSEFSRRGALPSSASGACCALEIAVRCAGRYLPVQWTVQLGLPGVAGASSSSSRPIGSQGWKLGAGGGGAGDSVESPFHPESQRGNTRGDAAGSGPGAMSGSRSGAGASAGAASAAGYAVDVSVTGVNGPGLLSVEVWILGRFVCSLPLVACHDVAVVRELLAGAAPQPPSDPAQGAAAAPAAAHSRAAGVAPAGAPGWLQQGLHSRAGDTSPAGNRLSPPVQAAGPASGGSIGDGSSSSGGDGGASGGAGGRLLQSMLASAFPAVPISKDLLYDFGLWLQYVHGTSAGHHVRGRDVGPHSGRGAGGDGHNALASAGSLLLPHLHSSMQQLGAASLGEQLASGTMVTDEFSLALRHLGESRRSVVGLGGSLADLAVAGLSRHPSGVAASFSHATGAGDAEAAASAQLRLGWAGVPSSLSFGAVQATEGGVAFAPGAAAATGATGGQGLTPGMLGGGPTGALLPRGYGLNSGPYGNPYLPFASVIMRSGSVRRASTGARGSMEAVEEVPGADAIDPGQLESSGLGRTMLFSGSGGVASGSYHLFSSNMVFPQLNPATGRAAAGAAAAGGAAASGGMALTSATQTHILEGGAVVTAAGALAGQLVGLLGGMQALGRPSLTAAVPTGSRRASRLHRLSATGLPLPMSIPESLHQSSAWEAADTAGSPPRTAPAALPPLSSLHPDAFVVTTAVGDPDAPRSHSSGNPRLPGPASGSASTAAHAHAAAADRRHVAPVQRNSGRRFCHDSAVDITVPILPGSLDLATTVSALQRGPAYGQKMQDVAVGLLAWMVQAGRPAAAAAVLGGLLWQRGMSFADVCVQVRRLQRDPEGGFGVGSGGSAGGDGLGLLHLAVQSGSVVMMQEVMRWSSVYGLREVTHGSAAAGGSGRGGQDSPDGVGGGGTTAVLPAWDERAFSGVTPLHLLAGLGAPPSEGEEDSGDGGAVVEELGLAFGAEAWDERDEDASGSQEGQARQQQQQQQQQQQHQEGPGLSPHRAACVMVIAAALQRFPEAWDMWTKLTDEYGTTPAAVLSYYLRDLSPTARQQALALLRPTLGDDDRWMQHAPVAQEPPPAAAPAAPADASAAAAPAASVPAARLEGPSAGGGLWLPAGTAVRLVELLGLTRRDRQAAHGPGADGGGQRAGAGAQRLVMEGVRRLTGWLEDPHATMTMVLLSALLWVYALWWARSSEAAVAAAAGQ